MAWNNSIASQGPIGHLTVGSCIQLAGLAMLSDFLSLLHERFFWTPEWEGISELGEALLNWWQRTERKLHCTITFQVCAFIFWELPMGLKVQGQASRLCPSGHHGKLVHRLRADKSIYCPSWNTVVTWIMEEIMKRQRGVKLCISYADKADSICEFIGHGIRDKKRNWGWFSLSVCSEICSSKILV